jgi:hypothetical protein
VWIIVLFGTLYARSTLAFPSVEGAGCRPEWLPSSKPNLRWFVHQSTEKPEFPAGVLFMDEPCFTWEGIFSSYNSHVWAHCCIQQCFVVNIWAGIVYDFLIRLTCYPDGSVDRFTACFCGPLFMSGLTATYNDHWIGQGRPVAWLPMSPDLTPVDFFLWGYMTALIDMLPVDSEEYLIVHFVEAVATIRQQPGIFECTCQSLLHCCWLCIEFDGHTFEHVL